MANELKLSGPLVVGSFSSDPVTGYNGEIYYNTTSNTFKVYQNSTWQTLSTGSASLTGQALNTQNVIVGDGSNLSAAVDTSSVGDILADSTNGLTIKSGVITNSEVNASAAIALSKLAALTINKALQSDGSGVISASSVTSTELGYVSGVTSAIQTQLNNKVNTSSVGAANGVAPLDSGGKVPYANLPSALMTFKGAWDASTNTPTLADGTGTTGDVYRASVAGTQNLGSGSQTWAVGDFAIYNGTIWQHSPAADGVSSVNGNTGAVTVNAINQLTGDVTAGPASGSQSQAATIAAGAVTASKLGTVTDGVTLDQSGSGSTLEIKSGGVGTTQLASAAVTAAKLGSVTDGVTLDQSATGSKLEIKAGGVGTTQLGTITDGVTLDQSGSGSTLEVKTGGISNTQINASAAIALTKLAALTANRVPVTNASGFLADNTSSDVILVSNSLQRGKSASNVVVEEYVDSTTLTDNSGPTSVTALQFAHGTYAGEEIAYVIETGAGTPDIRMGTLRIVSNGTNTSIIDTFQETADCGVTWSASISGSNTLLNYTTTNQGTNRTLRADRKLFRK